MEPYDDLSIYLLIAFGTPNTYSPVNSVSAMFLGKRKQRIFIYVYGFFVNLPEGSG